MTNQIPPQIKSAVIRAQTELVPGYTPLSTADWSTMEKVTEHLKPFAELILQTRLRLRMPACPRFVIGIKMLTSKWISIQVSINKECRIHCYTKHYQFTHNFS